MDKTKQRPKGRAKSDGPDYLTLARKTPLISIVRKHFPWLHIHKGPEGTEGTWEIHGSPLGRTLNITCKGSLNAVNVDWMEGVGTSGGINGFRFLDGVSDYTAMDMDEIWEYAGRILGMDFSQKMSKNRPKRERPVQEPGQIPLPSKKEEPKPGVPPPPSPIPGDRERIYDYLVNERKLPSELVSAGLEAGVIYPTRFDPDPRGMLLRQGTYLKRQDRELLTKAYADLAKGVPLSEQALTLTGKLPCCATFKMIDPADNTVRSYQRRMIEEKEFRLVGPKGLFMVGSYPRKGQEGERPEAIMFMEAAIEAMSGWKHVRDKFGEETANKILFAGCNGSSTWEKVVRCAAERGIKRVIGAMNADPAGRGYNAVLKKHAEENGMEFVEYLPPSEVEVTVARRGRYTKTFVPVLEFCEKNGYPVEKVAGETFDVYRLPGTAPICELLDQKVDKVGAHNAYKRLSGKNHGRNLPAVVNEYRDTMLAHLDELGVRTERQGVEAEPGKRLPSDWSVKVSLDPIPYEKLKGREFWGQKHDIWERWEAQGVTFSAETIVNLMAAALSEDPRVIEWRGAQDAKGWHPNRDTPLYRNETVREITRKFPVSDMNDLVRREAKGIPHSPQMLHSEAVEPRADLREFISRPIRQKGAQPEQESAVEPAGEMTP